MADPSILYVSDQKQCSLRARTLASEFSEIGYGRPGGKGKGDKEEIGYGRPVCKGKDDKEEIGYGRPVYEGTGNYNTHDLGSVGV